MLDLSRVPNYVIANCCYADKCVIRSRVEGLPRVSAGFYYEKINVRRLREMGLKIENGRAFSRMLKKSLLAYVSLRQRYDHSLAIAKAFRGLPLDSQVLFDYLGEQFRTAYDERERIVLENKDRLPATGWDIISNEENQNIVVYPASYLKRALDIYKRKLQDSYFYIIFCDESRCYPSLINLPVPSLGWRIGSLYYYNIVEEISSKYGYGSRNFIEFINKIADEIAISVTPGKSRPRIYIFARVKSPDVEVIRFSQFQEATRQYYEFAVRSLPGLADKVKRKPAVLKA